MSLKVPKLADGSESELWLNIGESCVFLSDHEKRRNRTMLNGMAFEDTDGMYFLILARLANFAPIHMRYVPYGILYRALHSKYLPKWAAIVNSSRLHLRFPARHHVRGLGFRDEERD